MSEPLRPSTLLPLTVATLLVIGAAGDLRAEELPWCAYDDPAAYNELGKTGGPSCPEQRPGVELPDTLYLPLPCGHWMAFRRVSVPARSPLDGIRPVFGYPMRGEEAAEAYKPALFGPWEAVVGGGFSEDAQHRPLRGDYRDLAFRSYYVARYELTELQFALFEDGLFGRPEASDPDHKVCAAARKRRIASRGRVRPKAGIDVFTAFRYVEAFNRWVSMIDRDRIGRGRFPWMPWEQGSPGFVRLPTEAEWELAAWGGPEFAPQKPTARQLHKVLRGGRIEDPDSVRRVAVVYEEGRPLSVRPVGTRLPNPLGLYDVVGNVEELVWDLFSAVRPDRRLAGHAGGMVARGGHYGISETEISVGYRTEIPIYTTEGPGRSAQLGVRLAVAAPFWTMGGDWKKRDDLNHGLLVALAEARKKELQSTGGSEEAARLEELRRQLEATRAAVRAREMDRERLEQELAQLASETTQLRMRLAEAERGRIRERVRSGIMLTKAIREFGGVALTILMRARDLQEAIRELPRHERAAYRDRLRRVCEGLAVRERQMDNQYDTLLGWVDELARAPEEVVDDAFGEAARDFDARRLTIYRDELELFREMVREARAQGGITADMRDRYFERIDLAGGERRAIGSCESEL